MPVNQWVNQVARKSGLWYNLKLIGKGFQMVRGLKLALEYFGEGLITAGEFVHVAKDEDVRYDMALAILVFEFPDLDWDFLDIPKPAQRVH